MLHGLQGCKRCVKDLLRAYVHSLWLEGLCVVMGWCCCSSWWFVDAYDIKAVFTRSCESGFCSRRTKALLCRGVKTSCELICYGADRISWTAIAERWRGHDLRTGESCAASCSLRYTFPMPPNGAWPIVVLWIKIAATAFRKNVTYL